MPVPQERGFFGSLNTIQELIESTCADKWDLLVRTALPAAGEAIWLLLIPSPEEILENYLNPRGRRGDKKRAQSGSGSRRLTRFGQLRWWQKISFPDIDQIIADAIPGADAIRGRKVGIGEDWIWRGIDVVDRGLWYWLLIDVGKTFVISWGSGIVESRFCTTPLNAILSMTATGIPADNNSPLWADPDDLVVSSNKGWHIFAQGKVERENTSIGVSGAIAVDFTAAIHEQHFPRKSEIRIRVSGQHVDGTSWIAISDPLRPLPGELFSLSIQTTVTNIVNATYHITVADPGVAVLLTNQSWGATMFLTPDL